MLHTDGEKGWGSASLPTTRIGDTAHVVSVAEKIAAGLESCGVIASGWAVPVEHAHFHPESAGLGCIREPNGSITKYQAQGYACITVGSMFVHVYVGDADAWVELKTRKSMKFPLSALLAA